jgi:predicted nuclease of predicted toxin-antitoxin system
MRVKLDENLPVELVEDFSARDHNVDSVVTEGLAGANDEAVLRAARSTGRILVTLDKGIADVRRYAPSAHPGVILLRLQRTGPGSARRALLHALPILERTARHGRLVVVTETAVRLRR